jgi:transposase
VKAYVKRGKSDALDAEAICEAVQRPTMRFVPVKTVEQQSVLMTHRARALLALLWQNYSLLCFSPICLLQYGHR